MVFRDASEKRRSIEAKERLAAIVEDSHDAIIGEDLHGVITSWNKAAENLFGYSAAEAIGRSIELIIPPERRSEFSGSVEQLRRGRHVAHIDTVRVRKEAGVRIDVSSHISPIKNAEGEVVGASKISHDITLRKRSEETLRFLAETDAGEWPCWWITKARCSAQFARLAVPYFADWCSSSTWSTPTARSNAWPTRIAIRSAKACSTSLSPRISAGLEFLDAFSTGAAQTGKPELVGEFSPSLSIGSVASRGNAGWSNRLSPVMHRGADRHPWPGRGNPGFRIVDGRAQRYGTDLELAAELAKRAGVAVENTKLYRDLKEAQAQKDDFLAMLSKASPAIRWRPFNMPTKSRTWRNQLLVRPPMLSTGR